MQDTKSQLPTVYCAVVLPPPSFSTVGSLNQVIENSKLKMAGTRLHHWDEQKRRGNKNTTGTNPWLEGFRFWGIIFDDTAEL